jgi:hypothetical protein
MRISVDFDGVLNDYVTGDFVYGLMRLCANAGAAAFMRRIVNNPYNKVYISSCRASTFEAVEEMRQWLLLVLGLTWTEIGMIEITHMKPIADIYIDDRGYRFEGEFPTETQLAALLPTWLEA